jgi:diguanylate cyclase (GGDEF)-like protein/PAS domain S-box-containing protein
MNLPDSATKAPVALIVDDERFMRVTLRQALEESGYAVIEAESGAAALERVRESAPDLVLLDIVMPGMDGFATCAALRGMPGGEDIPILMVTALEDAETINQAYEAGATDYIPKPINAPLLRHHLRYVLRASRLYRELQRNEARLLQAGKVFDHSSEMILISDDRGDIIDVNPAFCRLTDYSRAELVGSNIRTHSSMRHDDPETDNIWDSLAHYGCWQGEDWIRRKDGESFPTLVTINSVTTDEGEITHYVSIATDISKLRETEKRLDHLANFDPLTDLPNRLLFGDRIEQVLNHAARSTELVGLVLLDLDNYKEINETFGHQAGDEILRMVAKRLSGWARRSNTVARLGSDEFAIILRGLNRIEDGALIAQKIMETLSDPFFLEGKEFFLTASMGISFYPNDGQEAKELAQKAAAALTFAKQLGKNRYQFFADEMNSTNQERLLIKGGLRRAMERDELLLHYQLKFDSVSSRLTGMEALVRWQHPERGLVSPVHFIPIAEESGLIIPLGEQVLRKACVQNRAWQEMGFNPCRMAVNLSACQFRDPSLLSMITKVLEETGLDSSGLELEITESSLMQDTTLAINILKKLRELGISIALDDFGTGYSSLSYLRRFPVDKLKIDYSFVKNIFVNAGDAAIVKAIIGMAHSLKLKVVAEGVETEEQRVFLREQGCDELQGYLLIMPEPAAVVEKFLAQAQNSGLGTRDWESILRNS